MREIRSRPMLRTAFSYAITGIFALGLATTAVGTAHALLNP